MIARERLHVNGPSFDSLDPLFRSLSLSPRKRTRRIKDGFEPRRIKRRAIVGVVGVVLLLVLLGQGERFRKLALDVSTAFRYKAHPRLRTGRLELGPMCSFSNPGADDEWTKSRRRAIVTLMRTERYLPLLDHLACSVAKSNPDLEFAVMVTRSISPTMVRKLREERGLKLLYVDELQFPNSYEPRFRYNWLKLRAWELPYDEILLVDSDTVILEDVSALFSLPTRFAAVLDQVNWLQKFKYPGSLRIFQGGVLFLRPCPAVARHMQMLLEEDPLLWFSTSNAEQEFLSWYFQHEAFLLPERYNTLPSRLEIQKAISGSGKPVIVHYTSNKPFGAYRSAEGPNMFLCTEAEMTF